VRLDLPANPDKYLAVRSGLDNRGQLIVELANPTRVAVADVGLAVRYVDSQGTILHANRQLTGRLAPNEAQRWATGLGPFTTTEATEVTVASARVVAE
jgi:hypothetical protein